jgi:hypothetical protein
MGDSIDVKKHRFRVRKEGSEVNDRQLKVKT